MKKNKFKSVGFDLGDTLIEYESVPLNWKDLYTNALRGVLKVCNLSFSKEKIKVARAILLKYNTRENPRTKEVKASQIFSEILSEWGVLNNQMLNKSITKFFSFFRMKIKIYKDTIPVLKELKKRKINIGVFTDVPYGMSTEYVKKDVNPIKQYLDTILSSVDVGYRKPEKKIFTALLKALATKKQDMIYVGNEEKDIIGAKNAGIFAIFLDRNRTNKSFGEDKKISSLYEVLDLFS